MRGASQPHPFLQILHHSVYQKNFPKSTALRYHICTKHPGHRIPLLYIMSDFSQKERKRAANGEKTETTSLLYRPSGGMWERFGAVRGSCTDRRLSAVSATFFENRSVGGKSPGVRKVFSGVAAVRDSHSGVSSAGGGGTEASAAVPGAASVAGGVYGFFRFFFDGAGGCASIHAS